MSTRPSTGRRARKDGEETDVFDHRRAIGTAHAERVRKTKRTAARRERRAGRRSAWTE